MTRFTALAALAFALLAGCSTTRSVRPVGEGKWAAGGSIGGPLFTNLGPPIPAPMVSAYARRGLDARTDLDFGLYFPVIAATGFDVGASRLLVDQDGAWPAVMGGGRLLAFANALVLSGEDPNGKPYGFSPRLFEELYANASWRVGEASLAWAGISLFLQAEALIARPTIQLGFEWRASRLFGLALELKQLSFLTNQRFAAVAFVGPADYGAFAAQVGFNFYPGSDE